MTKHQQKDGTRTITPVMVSDGLSKVSHCPLTTVINEQQPPENDLTNTCIDGLAIEIYKVPSGLMMTKHHQKNGTRTITPAIVLEGINKVSHHPLTTVIKE